jgi:hypothetical protein
MTPDEKITLWVSAILAFPTIVFTGWVAWWTWKRDQERIRVQYSPIHWRTVDGVQTDETLSGLGVVLTNLSLFPVRIVALGLWLPCGKHLDLDRDAHEKDWPFQIESRSRVLVVSTPTEWTQLKGLGAKAAIKENKVVAVALTETGYTFHSRRVGLVFLRPIRWLQRRWKKILWRA